MGDFRRGLHPRPANTPGPNAGLEEPALGGPAQEATQRRLFTAASSDIPADFATALLTAHTRIDEAWELGYNCRLTDHG